MWVWVLAFIFLIVAGLLWGYMRVTDNVIGGNAIGNKEIFVVRHGQTEPNVKKMSHDNHTPEGDAELTDEGVWQAKQTGKYLSQFGPFDLIIASPRCRTQLTAKYIAKGVGYKGKIVTNPLLLESKAGVFAGKTRIESAATLAYNTELSKIKQKMKNQPNPILAVKNKRDLNREYYNLYEKEYGVSHPFKHYKDYEKFLEWLPKQKAHKIIIVAHGGTVKGLMSTAAGLPASLVPRPNLVEEFGNCIVTYMQYGRDVPYIDYTTPDPKYFVMTTADNSHLEKEK